MLPFFKKTGDQLLTPSWEKPRGIFRRSKRSEPAPVHPDIEPLYPQADRTARASRVQEPVAPASRPAATAPARLPYSHPTRKAERAVQKAKARVQHAERIARYLTQGLDEAEAERRANYDAYKGATGA